jgi:DNA-binding MarR family transcriptional regulator
MRSRKNITEEQKTLGALLRLPYEKLMVQTYKELAQTDFADIRPAHSNVFRYISPTGSRVTDLAEKAQLAKQSMAYLVNSLHENGYVRLLPDPLDGRAKLVQLTERGEAFQVAAIKLSRQLETKLAQRLGTKEMANLRHLLNQLARSLDEIQSNE